MVVPLVTHTNMSFTLNSDESKVSYDAAWVVGCRVVSIGCTTVSSFLIARILGPDGFGVFLLITTVLGFGYLLGTGGLDVAGLRFVSEKIGLSQYRNAGLYLDTARRWAIASTLLASLAVIVVLSVFRGLVNQSEISMLVVVMIGAGVLALAWQRLASNLLRGLNDIRSASFFSGGQTGGPLSNLIFLIPLVFALVFSISLSTSTVIALLVGSICLVLPFALWSLNRASRVLKRESDKDEQKNLSETESLTLRGVALSLLAIQLLAFITVQADMWIGSCMLVPQDFGFYGAAKRAQLFAHLPLQMALMTIQGTIPRLFAQGRMQELERVIRSATTYSSLVAIPPLLLLVAFPTECMTLCFGESFADASPIVLPLVVGMIGLLLFGTPAGVLAITGNHRIVLPR